MRKKRAVGLLLGSMIAIPSGVFAESATEAVERFYHAATTEGLCNQAIEIRPDYSHSQCKTLKNVKIKTLKTIKENDNEAIVYLNMRYETNKARRFRGHLHLCKKEQQWIIFSEDYKSSKAMSRGRYIKTYMGTAEGKLQRKVQQRDTLSGNHRKVLDRLVQYSPIAAKKYPIVLVDTSAQEMSFYEKGRLKKIYPISTASKGEGNKLGREQTPLGIHIVKEKFGENAPLGSIFVGRQATGKIADIIHAPINRREDHVTSRILWLEGLEEGKNKLGEVDSHDRFIYIHGTNEEGLIGRKASHGCIRMMNKDVIKLFKQVPIGSLVYIGL
jgi:lipoprotein-anchoring transpeptidase ErfK/SrfK